MDSVRAPTISRIAPHWTSDTCAQLLFVHLGARTDAKNLSRDIRYECTTSLCTDAKNLSETSYAAFVLILFAVFTSRDLFLPNLFDAKSIAESHDKLFWGKFAISVEYVFPGVSFPSVHVTSRFVVTIATKFFMNFQIVFTGITI